MQTPRQASWLVLSHWELHMVKSHIGQSIARNLISNKHPTQKSVLELQTSHLLLSFCPKSSNFVQQPNHNLHLHLGSLKKNSYVLSKAFYPTWHTFVPSSNLLHLESNPTWQSHCVVHVNPVVVIAWASTRQAHIWSHLERHVRYHFQTCSPFKQFLGLNLMLLNSLALSRF